MIDKLSPADAKWVAKAREDFIQRVDGKEIAALRARVAKLEAALLDCKRYAEDHDDEWVPFRVDDALKDAPQ